MSADQTGGVSPGNEFAIGRRVRVRPTAEPETIGTIVEDFGDTIGVSIDVGDTHVVDAARRWAIVTDDGGLTFADSEHLTAE